MTSSRNTVQKQIILSAVDALDIHATAEQVYQHVAAAHPSISKATVYRNLRQAAERGELLNIGTLDGSAHYDHRTHNHSHFLCEHCGKVVDVEADFSDIISRAQSNAQSGAQNSAAIRIDNYQLSFGGLCESCK